MRQHQVLLVADADFVEGEFLGDVGDSLHLHVGRITRNAADRLQRDGDAAIIRVLVRIDVLLHPAGKFRIGLLPGGQARPALGPLGQIRRCEIGGNGLHIGVGQLELGVLQMREFGFHLPRQLLDAGFVHEDLDARLVLVVARPCRL